MNPRDFIIFDLSLNREIWWKRFFPIFFIKKGWWYSEKQWFWLKIKKCVCFSRYPQQFLMIFSWKTQFQKKSWFRDRSNIIKTTGFIFYGKRMVLNVRKKSHKGFRVVSDFAVNLNCEEQDFMIFTISASRIFRFSSICWRLQQARSRRSVGVRQ